MKKISIALVLLLVSIAIKAQEKISVAIIPLTYDEERISKNDARIVQQTVVNALVSSKRIAVVDREKLEELEKEKKLQRTEAFMDSKESFKDGISKGASCLIDGNIMSIRHTESKGGWSSAVYIQLKVLDVSTGEILSTENISSELLPLNEMVKSAMKTYFTKDEVKVEEMKEQQLKKLAGHSDDAFAIALQRLDENVRKFATNSFPFAIKIVEWNKKKENEFVLNAGHNLGIHKGQLLDIVKIAYQNIDGETIERKQKIASAWVYRIDDANFSAAVVIDGEKELKKAKKANATLGLLTR